MKKSMGTYVYLHPKNGARGAQKIDMIEML